MKETDRGRDVAVISGIIVVVIIGIVALVILPPTQPDIVGILGTTTACPTPQPPMTTTPTAVQTGFAAEPTAAVPTTTHAWPLGQEQVSVSVYVGTTRNVFDEQLLISVAALHHAAEPARYTVFAKVGSPGYETLDIEGEDVGYAAIYEAKETFEIRILAVNSVVARFLVTRIGEYADAARPAFTATPAHPPTHPPSPVETVTPTETIALSAATATHTSTPTATGTSITTATPISTPTATATPISTPTATATPSSTPTPTSMPTTPEPTGSSVTGGGWINSPEGAYAADPSLTGKATFGFVSDCKNGTTVTTGQTEFQFSVAGVDFHSDHYDSLVIEGARAQFMGMGTVNRQGGYGFMLVAIDGQIEGGGGTDKFRIKIWDKYDGTVVYDNEVGSADDADPTTVLARGSIVIH